MKTALAIVCSLLLVWTPVVPAQAPAASVVCPARACCHCGQACRCATRSLPESQPVSATPASSNVPNPLLTLAPATVAWVLPDVPARGTVPATFSLVPTSGAPLYARNCAFLI